MMTFQVCNKLADAQAALATTPGHRIFAFDANDKGVKTYAVASIAKFESLCLEALRIWDRRGTAYRFSNVKMLHAYEHLPSHVPRVIYADLEYYEAHNPGRDPNTMLDGVVHYVTQQLQSLGFMDEPQLRVETCHRDGKVSFHLKVLNAVVANQDQERAFWKQLLTRLGEDHRNQDPRALMLRVVGASQSFIDEKVYGRNQLMRALGAAKHPKPNETRSHPFLLKDKGVEAITPEAWRASLILRPDGPVTLQVPTTSSGSSGRQRGEMAQEVVSESTELQDLAAQVLREIDGRWQVRPSDLVVTLINEQSKALQVLPDAVRITVPGSCYCPLKGAEHSSSAVSVRIQQTGHATLHCLAQNHPPRIKETRLFLRRTPAVDELLYHVWALDRWIDALNQRFVQTFQGARVMILEEYTDASGTYTIEERREKAIRSLFVGFRGYLKVPKPAPKPTASDDSDEDAMEVEDDAPKPVQFAIRHVDPILDWLTSPRRRRSHTTCYMPGQPRDIDGRFNFWCGFGVEPAIGEPVAILEHLRTVICSGNQEHYDYLLKWFAWTVQFPDRKSEVAVVLLGKKGTGKSSIGKICHGIFGNHAFETSQKHHLFGKFNAHLAHKNMLIINEAVWGGDKRYESVLKAAVTDPFGPVEGKGENAFSGRNYWNLLVFSNDAWAVPATLDSRRFFVLEVSDQRVDDAAYFDRLHDCIDDPVELGCFLRYLQEHPIPPGWRPAAHLPRTRALLNQALQGNAAVDLRWLVEHLRPEPEEAWRFEYRRWSTQEGREIVTQEDIMQRGVETVVPKKVLLEAYKHDANNNIDLRRNGKLYTESDLAAFFTEHLNPDLFKSNYRPRANNRQPQFWFAPYEAIRGHFLTKYLGEDFFDAPVACPSGHNEPAAMEDDALGACSSSHDEPAAMEDDDEYNWL